MAAFSHKPIQTEKPCRNGYSMPILLIPYSKYPPNVEFLSSYLELQNKLSRSRVASKFLHTTWYYENV